jgi:PHD-finger
MSNGIAVGPDSSGCSGADKAVADRQGPRRGEGGGLRSGRSRASNHETNSSDEERESSHSAVSSRESPANGRMTRRKPEPSLEAETPLEHVPAAPSKRMRLLARAFANVPELTDSQLLVLDETCARPAYSRRRQRRRSQSRRTTRAQRKENDDAPKPGLTLKKHASKVRLGTNYQVSVLPPCTEFNGVSSIEYASPVDGDDTYRGDVLWDPALAETAPEGDVYAPVRRFQHELNFTMLLLEAIHKSMYDLRAVPQQLALLLQTDTASTGNQPFYSVALSSAELDRLEPQFRLLKSRQNQSRDVPLTQQGQDEILVRSWRDMFAFARKIMPVAANTGDSIAYMKRGVVLVAYYRWKASCADYYVLKEAARNAIVDTSDPDECEICHDGGLLVICDSCGKVYHPSCLNLPLSLLDNDNPWFCPPCEAHPPLLSPLGCRRKQLASPHRQSPALRASPSHRTGASSSSSLNETLAFLSADRLLNPADQGSSNEGQVQSSTNALAETLAVDVESARQDLGTACLSPPEPPSTTYSRNGMEGAAARTSTDAVSTSAAASFAHPQRMQPSQMPPPQPHVAQLYPALGVPTPAPPSLASGRQGQPHWSSPSAYAQRVPAPHHQPPAIPTYFDYARPPPYSWPPTPQQTWHLRNHWQYQHGHGSQTLYRHGADDSMVQGLGPLVLPAAADCGETAPAPCKLPPKNGGEAVTGGEGSLLKSSDSAVTDESSRSGLVEWPSTQADGAEEESRQPVGIQDKSFLRVYHKELCGLRYENGDSASVPDRAIPPLPRDGAIGS